MRRARAGAEPPAGRHGVPGLAPDDADGDSALHERHALLRRPRAVEGRRQPVRIGAVVDERDVLAQHPFADPRREGAVFRMEGNLAERRREHDHRLRPQRGAVAAGLERTQRQRFEPGRHRRKVLQLGRVAVERTRVRRPSLLRRDELHERTRPALVACDTVHACDGVLHDRVCNRASERRLLRQRAEVGAEELDAVVRRRRFGRGEGGLHVAHRSVRRRIRLAARRLGQAGSRHLGIERAERHPCVAAPGAERDLLLGVLVGEPRAAEAQQVLPLAQELDVIGACALEQLGDHNPTCTSRKRAGTVPWPTWAT